MHDIQLLLRALSDFSRVLLTSYDVQTVLGELAEKVTEVLGLSGSGVSLTQGGGVLRFVTGTSPAVERLERLQEEEHQEGPSLTARQSGELVAVADVTAPEPPWPEYVARAGRLGLRAVAGVPMRLENQVVGVLTMYDERPREWSDEDLAVARILADMATSYVVSASKLHQEQRLNEQLNEALQNRLVIEQAKGIIANARGIPVDEAFLRIRKHARDHNASVRAVADAIVHVGLRV